MKKRGPYSLETDLILFKKKYRVSRRIPAKQMILFCFHMSLYLRAHIPPLVALKSFVRETRSKKSIRILEYLIKDIQGFGSFSQALQKFQRFFDPIFLNLLLSSERSGHLEQGFEYYGTFLKWWIDIRDKIGRALLYPIGLFLVLAVLFVSGYYYFLPYWMQTLHEGLSAPSSPPSFLYVAGLMSSSLLIGLGFYYVYKKTLFLSRFLYKFPLIGSYRRAQDIALWAYQYVLLYRSGHSDYVCQSILAHRTTSPYFSFVLKRLCEKLYQGEPFIKAIQDMDFFPDLCVHFLQKGQVEKERVRSLEEIYTYYGDRIRSQLQSIMDFFPPFFVLSAGLLIITFIWTILQPLYGQTFSMVETI